METEENGVKVSVVIPVKVIRKIMTLADLEILTDEEIKAKFESFILSPRNSHIYTESKADINAVNELESGLALLFVTELYIDELKKLNDK